MMILAPVIRMVLTVSVRNIQMPYRLVNVLTTNKNISEHVTRTPSYSLFKKKMNAMVQPSLLVNVLNFYSAIGAIGSIAQKPAALV